MSPTKPHLSEFEPDTCTFTVIGLFCKGVNLLCCAFIYKCEIIMYALRGKKLNSPS